MKQILSSLVILIVLASCGSRNNSDYQGNNVTIQSTALPGFNVNNFANLVRKTKKPSEIEAALNKDDNDINNLDLNKDGNVDFLKVVESENQLKVVDDVDPNNSVNVATLNITRNNDMADMQIQGNPSYCGQDYMYHSSFSVGELLLLSYMFAPHPYYVPIYHYGFYPSYYHSYNTGTYRTVTHTYSSSNRSSVNNSFNSSRSSVGNPVHSQRSFSTRDNSSPTRSGGFGRSSSSGFGRSSSSGFGRSSFGGGRSSFGRRR